MVLIYNSSCDANDTICYFAMGEINIMTKSTLGFEIGFISGFRLSHKLIGEPMWIVLFTLYIIGNVTGGMLIWFGSMKFWKN